MYFDFETYARMLRLAAAERDPRGRRVARTAAFGVLPAMAAVNAGGFALDPLLFPGLRDVEVRDPVFIVGHARSGTTLMHRLLAMDSERFSFFRFYEMFLPALVWKRAARAIGAADRRFAGGRIEAGIRRGEERALANTASEHRTSLFAPEGVERLAEGLQGRLARGAGGESVHDQAQPLGIQADHVVLRREVSEEGARRDVGGGGDVRDRDAVEGALGDQAAGRVGDALRRPGSSSTFWRSANCSAMSPGRFDRPPEVSQRSTATRIMAMAAAAIVRWRRVGVRAPSRRASARAMPSCHARSISRARPRRLGVARMARLRRSTRSRSSS